MKWKHLALPHLNTLFSTFSFKGHLLSRRETKLPFAEKKVDAIFAAIISQLKRTFSWSLIVSPKNVYAELYEQVTKKLHKEVHLM